MKNQLATYHGTITIPTIIKIFSINVKFSQKSAAAHNAESFKNLFDITIN
jgi:hypothetical protein